MMQIMFWERVRVVTGGYNRPGGGVVVVKALPIESSGHTAAVG